MHEKSVITPYSNTAKEQIKSTVINTRRPRPSVQFMWLGSAVRRLWRPHHRCLRTSTI